MTDSTVWEMTNTLNDLQMYMHMYLWLIDWIGTFSNDDNNGSENVAKRMNLHFFKLNRIYLDPPNISNASAFSWSWIVKDFTRVQKEEGKFVVVSWRPP